MIKPSDPRRLAIDLLSRSVCAIRVAAVIADNRAGLGQSIFSWGWNNSGRDGYGEHAEMAAVRRANKRRLVGSAIYIAAKRGGIITAKPCSNCQRALRGYGLRWMVWRDREGWHTEEIN